MSNEQQKIEELLKPRYEVIADYPDSSFGIGEIIRHYTDVEYPLSEEKFKNLYSPYPHLFKPLQWWEKRSVEEMPEYVKVTETGEVYRVTRYYIDHNFACFYTGELEKRGKLKGTETPFNLEACTPATKSEFKIYKENK